MGTRTRRDMSEQEIRTGDGPDAGRYEIRLTGHLDARWAAWFEGLTLSHEADGITVIGGAIADQAALHGVLQRIRDMGLSLVSVTQVGDGLAPPPTGAP